MRDGITLFGSPLRSRVLLLLALLEESYVAELARALGADYQTVRTIVVHLEEDGVLVGLDVGRQRRLRLNFRYPEARRLKELLLALAEVDEKSLLAAAAVRRRPRARNKPL